MSAPIVGIDLGTTNSCCAMVDRHGEAVLIPYRGGEYTMPSIYAVDDKGKELVGSEAKRQWMLNPKHTVFGAKRLVGTRYDSTLVENLKRYVTYELAPGADHDVRVVVRNQPMSLADVSSKILAKIREVASEHLRLDVTRAVITVPAYYNDRQRQIVREAGKLAGLEVVGIINEPTAAALAFGAHRGTKQTVAIYDLGGGTFDISVIEIRDRVFEVKSTGGDIFLGGIDFDAALMNFALSSFRDKNGIDLAVDPVAMQRLRDAVERAKVDLSSRTATTLSIPFITMTPEGRPLDLELTLDRKIFEQLTLPLIQRTLKTCVTVLREAHLDPRQIDAVLLVGGQTRMPLIHQMLEDFFGKPPSKGVHPDEAVAIGAAYYAKSFEENSDVRLQLLDVLPMAIGIERAEGTLHRLFERNAGVPNQRAFIFTTHHDEQADLVMRILQGDKAQAAHNTLLGEFTFSGLRPGPAGSVRVEVIFDVSVEGILTLQARDLDTGVRMKQTVRFDQSDHLPG